MPDGVHAITLSVLGLSTSSKLRSQDRSASKSLAATSHGRRAATAATAAAVQRRCKQTDRGNPESTEGPPTAHRLPALLSPLAEERRDGHHAAGQKTLFETGVFASEGSPSLDLLLRLVERATAFHGLLLTYHQYHSGALSSICRRHECGVGAQGLNSSAKGPFAGG